MICVCDTVNPNNPALNKINDFTDAYISNINFEM